MISIVNTKIKDVFIGSQPIKAIYQGANLIWQRITKIPRTVMGGTSVTLTDTNDERSLVLLEMQGASGGSGDLGANVFNIDDITITSTYASRIIKNVNDLVVNNYYQTISDFNPHLLKPSTKYTIKFHCIKSAYGNQVQGRIALSNGSSSFNLFSTAPANTLEFDGIQTFTTPADISTYNKIWIYGWNNNVTTEFKNIQIIEGTYTNTTMPSYQPYGYKIGALSWSTILDSNNVIKRTNNTFGGGITLNTYPESMTYTMNGSGSTTAGVQVTTRTPLSDLGFKPNVSYTIEARLLSGSWSGDLRTYVYLNGSFWKNIQFTQSNKAPSFTYTFTEADMSKTFGFNAYNAVINGVTNVFDNVVIQFSAYESNKTPISLPTYIGSTPLGNGEKVSVDFEKKSAMRGTTDLTNLNQTLLNAEQTTHEGTTVLTDNSTNKVSGISVDYWASKE